MKKLAKKKWIWIISAFVVGLAVVAGLAWKHFVDQKTGVPKLASIPIDEEHFPDRSFRQYVSMEYDLDTDGVLSGVERWKVRKCYLPRRQIEDLKGIEYFPRLRELGCSWNKLESLDVSQNTELFVLSCSNNILISLDISNNVDLQILECSNNNLNSLDVSNNIDLQTLYCSGNDLSSLDVSNSIYLRSLSCETNKLESLNVTGCVYLDSINCRRNALTSLDISNFTSLQYLYCSSNKLESLNVTGCLNLNYIECEHNALTSLDLSTCMPGITAIIEGNPMRQRDIIRNLPVDN